MFHRSMCWLTVAVCWVVLTAVCFAQSDRGTITGTILDSANAVVPNARVVAVHTETGSRYEAVSTGTGNYTLVSLPSGVYDVSVEVGGFKKFVQQGVRVQVAQTARVDVVLQIGSASESVTVTADAPLLRTESAEQSTTMPGARIEALPMNFAISQGGAIRNPFSFVTLAPGTQFLTSSTANLIRVNGSPQSSFKFVFEGQDATNPITQQTNNHMEPSVDSVEEFTLQSSNFAAEFGQVSGGLFNFTTKSGTNQFHGNGYEYLVNEALNAGQPFTDDGKGHLIRMRTRKHDLGGTVGGPLIIPKLYDGHNNTFFFFNLESYINRNINSGTFATVPTDAMRNGDFSQILTGRTLNTDPLGRSILENTIYDPLTSRVVGGKVVRDPFDRNMIPNDRLDPVAKKIQALFPAPSNASLVNNFAQVYPWPRTQIIRSFKLDHNFSDKTKASFYWMWYTSHEFAGLDGLPIPVTAMRDKHVYSHTLRLNFDHSLTPTLLLHAGIGMQHFHNPDTSPPGVLQDFDAVKQLGLTGGAVNGFPRMTNLSNSYGGMMDIGPTNTNKYYTDKPTAVVSATWIHGSHQHKAGADWRIDAWTTRNWNGSSGNYSFSGVESGLPSTQGQSLSGGSVGFPYASFLLGRVNSASINAPQDPQLRKQSLALFVQDTWKVTRNLTLDYGLRWDRAEQGHELYYRMSSFGPDTPNPSAGGLLGGTVYTGFGQGRCNCTSFSKTYPYAFGPRLGIAYKIDPKTVFRAGWGITYGATASYSYVSIVAPGFNRLSFPSTSYGDPAVVLRNGLQYSQADLYKVVFDPGRYPSPGNIDGPPYWMDRNSGRPPRINQWNISLQREIITDLVVEAAYVGSRGVWFPAGSLISLNALTPERIKSFGLDESSAADRSLLTSRMDSSQVIARGFKAPYAGWPTSLTLAQALRPYPQFGNINAQWAPLGSNWYDALQTKVTKRYSHGLDLSTAFTWQKELSLGADGGPVNDVFNRKLQKVISPLSMPFVLATAFTYQIPRLGANRWVRTALGDWTIGGMFRYASGQPIQVPSAQNALSSTLFRGTFANRVPGQPLFLKDLNCHCINPNTDFVLNPKAWSDPAQGQWGTSAAFYSDYRTARRYDEQLSLGRIFRIREKMSFSVRAEFFNVFNRTYLNNPDSGNALATQTLKSGVVVSGFGRVNAGSVFAPPRNGQLVARFQW